MAIIIRKILTLFIVIGLFYTHGRCITIEDEYSDRNAGIRLYLNDCIVDRKDTIQDVMVTYLKRGREEYKVVSTERNMFESLTIGGNYDLTIEIIKSKANPLYGNGCYQFGINTTICLDDTVYSTDVRSHEHLYKFVRMGSDSITHNDTDPRIRHRGERILNIDSKYLGDLGVRYLTDIVLKDIPTLSKCDIQVAYDYSLFLQRQVIYNRLRDSYERLYSLNLPRITEKDCPFYMKDFNKKKPFYSGNEQIVAFSGEWEVRKKRCELTVISCILYMGNINLCFELTDFPRNESYSGVVIMDSEGNLINYYISKEDVTIPIDKDIIYRRYQKKMRGGKCYFKLVR